eukprot:4078725-Karenia_brevis.AAC.1
MKQVRCLEDIVTESLQERFGKNNKARMQEKEEDKAQKGTLLQKELAGKGGQARRDQRFKKR